MFHKDIIDSVPEAGDVSAIADGKAGATVGRIHDRAKVFAKVLLQKHTVQGVGMDDVEEKMRVYFEEQRASAHFDYTSAKAQIDRRRVGEDEKSEGQVNADAAEEVVALMIARDAVLACVTNFHNRTMKHRHG